MDDNGLKVLVPVLLVLAVACSWVGVLAEAGAVEFTSVGTSVLGTARLGARYAVDCAVSAA